MKNWTLIKYYLFTIIIVMPLIIHNAGLQIQLFTKGDFFLYYIFFMTITGLFNNYLRAKTLGLIKKSYPFWKKFDIILHGNIIYFRRFYLDK